MLSSVRILSGDLYGELEKLSAQLDELTKISGYITTYASRFFIVNKSPDSNAGDRESGRCGWVYRGLDQQMNSPSDKGFAFYFFA